MAQAAPRPPPRADCRLPAHLSWGCGAWLPAPRENCFCPQLRAQVGAGRCLAVDCSLKAQQQAKAVIRHFNVRVTPADIFSRCQVGATCPRLGEGPVCVAQAL